MFSLSHQMCLSHLHQRYAMIDPVLPHLQRMHIVCFSSTRVFLHPPLMALMILTRITVMLQSRVAALASPPPPIALPYCILLPSALSLSSSPPPCRSERVSPRRALLCSRPGIPEHAAKISSRDKERCPTREDRCHQLRGVRGTSVGAASGS